MADHGVERPVFEGQLLGVCLTPLHGARGCGLAGQVQHLLVQVRRDDRDAFGQR